MCGGWICAHSGRICCCSTVEACGVGPHGRRLLGSTGRRQAAVGPTPVAARPRLCAAAGMSSVGAAPTAPDLPALSVRALRVSSGARALDSLRAVLLDVEAMALSLIFFLTNGFVFDLFAICISLTPLLCLGCTLVCSPLAPSFVSLGLFPDSYLPV